VDSFTDGYLNFHDHFHAIRHNHIDRDLHPDLYGLSNGHINVHRNSHCHEYTNRHAYQHSDRYSHCNTNLDRHVYGIADKHINTVCDSYCYLDTH